MLKGQPLTAYIPVRGGSKGIPRKNLYRLNGQTLLERAIGLAKSCDRIDRIVVSTDDPEMYSIARRHGVSETGLRPAHLATDEVGTIDVIQHSLTSGEAPEGFLLLLQVTTPLRTRQDLEEVLDLLESASSETEGVASVVPLHSPHPNKVQKIVGGYLARYLDGPWASARQRLPAVYALNGAFYLTHTTMILNQRTLLPDRTLPYEMPPERSINLDSPLDLLLLEAVVERGLVHLEEYEP